MAQRKPTDAETPSRPVRDIVVLTLLQDTDGPCDAIDLAHLFARTTGEMPSNGAMARWLKGMLAERLVQYPTSSRLNPIDMAGKARLYVITSQGRKLLARWRKILAAPPSEDGPDLP